jgi:citrate/tricarballylate utilization protein
MANTELPVLGAAHSGAPVFLDPAFLADAQRQLEICNACRYCEGLCGVFPALERRTAFSEGDVSFLAHLCHDCQTCYNVCPYTPPHEFAINIPRLMSEVRDETYKHYSSPPVFGSFLSAYGARLAVILVLSLVVALAASYVWAGIEGLTSAHVGPGAFYKVMPWLWMFVPATALTVIGLGLVTVGVVRYWRDLGTSEVQAGVGRSLLGAVRDALTLRYMDGGGPGCDYPVDAPSPWRKRHHALVFWGFVAAFISTTLAFVNQEILGVLPPYPYISAPVIFGTVGGVMMIVGGIGLLELKRRADRELTDATMVIRDYSFLAALLIINVTGLVLLAFRETPMMGLLLNLHLASFLAFFITAPYGKIVHAVYRTAALLRNRLEDEGVREGG